jgi:tRNA (guanine37-N1)-methyltransferase
VPPVLLSGHHAEVARWRRAESERITRERRPDLWERHQRNDAAAAPQG